jgi:transposase
VTPTVRSSAERAWLGHISRQGSPHIRWAMVEAAHKAIIGAGPLRSSFERIARRRGRKIATVAVARKLLTLCY